MKTTPVCYMMIGLPGSGKSTYCEQIITEMPDVKIASSDEYIEQHAAKNNLTYGEVYRQLGDEAQKYASRQIQKFIKEKNNFIWDQTNVFASARAKKLRNLFSNHYDVVAITLEVPVEILQKRLDERTSKTGKFIGPKVMQELTENYSRPTYAEGFKEIYLINEKKEIILLDKPRTKLSVK